ncbi:hypothetical protein VRRI112168_03605 [Vreelandella rituensis]|uniref:DUF559 domain-containing protein n=1 Tax=Vreelandella rituensis TaxID=2282306 RepID=A0A368U953_9GAMM|nr:hypothetical protein [Halomonas rituensis]RCV93739.1 hypothetical protein DU506_00875 [Halomonas rituensis]
MSLRLSLHEAKKLGIHSKAPAPAKPKPKGALGHLGTSAERSPPQRTLFQTLRIVPETARFSWVWEVKDPVPGRKFSLDIGLHLSPLHKLGIEVDGFRHHGLSKEGFYRDREKDFLLDKHGWKFIRVPAGLIEKDINLVLSRIAYMAQRLEAQLLRERLQNAPTWWLSRWKEITRSGLPPLPWTLYHHPAPEGWFTRHSRTHRMDNRLL